MSFVSTFVMSHLLEAIEAEFVKSEPAMAQAIMGEVSTLIIELETWVNRKITPVSVVQQ